LFLFEYIAIKIGGHILKFILNRLSPDQITELKDLIEKLKLNSGGQPLCEGLTNVTKKGTISFETFYLLSKRCNTNPPRKFAEDISRKISDLLFSQTVPRPSDSEFNSIEICMM
jgi:hypothetical protein